MGASGGGIAQIIRFKFPYKQFLVVGHFGYCLHTLSPAACPELAEGHLPPGGNPAKCPVAGATGLGVNCLRIKLAHYSIFEIVDLNVGGA